MPKQYVHEIFWSHQHIRKGVQGTTCYRKKRNQHVCQQSCTSGTKALCTWHAAQGCMLSAECVAAVKVQLLALRLPRAASPQAL